MILTEVLEKIQNTIDVTDTTLTNRTTGTTVRDAISASLVSIARQHYKTIYHSVKVHKQYNSAFTLLRPLIDATYRAIWAMIVATENQVNRIGNGSRDFDSTQELSKKIDRKEDVEIFHNVYFDNSSILHGMTHGGLELIGRQMNEGFIEPNFEDSELVGLLNEATSNYSLLLFYYGKYINDEELMLMGGNLVKEISETTIAEEHVE